MKSFSKISFLSAGALVLLLTVVALEFTTPKVQAATLTVNSTGDGADFDAGDGTCETASGNGVCTLRAAIQEANALAGTDIINFSISGTGVKTITPATVLPTVSGVVTIDGSTQTGSSCGDLWGGTAPTWNIVIDGDSASFDGLTVSAGSSTIKGMEIKEFRNGLVVTTAGSNTIQCMKLHSNSGNSTHGNGLTVASASNAIGGTSAGQGNILSGNTGVGLLVSSGNTNLIRGNFVGTNDTGTAPNPNDAGIALTGGTGAIIGGTTTGAGNLLSGNTGLFQSAHVEDLVIGIWVGETANDTIIQGNYFGCNRTCTSALYTGVDRVSKEVVMKADRTIIGGTTAGARNIVVPLHTGLTTHDNADGTIIQGNYIGLNATGTEAIAPAVENNADGIHDSGTNTLVGGTTPGAGNVISGFQVGQGIEKNGGSGLIVHGNIFGSDYTGNVSHPQFDNANGVMLLVVNNNTIGGTTAAERNIFGSSTVSAMGGSGVSIIGGANNTVQGNYIGVGADGTTALPNIRGIIMVGTGTENNLIGGTATGAGNIIANNAAAGIGVGDVLGVGAAGVGNTILGNSIYNNVGLGIDLANGTAHDGPTANDSNDSDTGPNNFQNFPVLTSATISGGSLSVAGTLTSLASTIYRLEFFSNTAADSSGYGEGKTYLGATSVTTDGTGNVSFSVTNLSSAPLGAEISATASQDLGTGYYSTSEFSQTITVTSSSSSSSSSSGGSGGTIIPQIPSMPSTTTPTTPSQPTVLPDPSVGATVERNLNAERLAIGVFAGLFRRLPVSSPDWLAVNHLAYANIIERNLPAEREGLIEFTRRFARLPDAATDWLIIHVLGFLKL